VGSATETYDPPVTNTAHTTEITIDVSYGCTDPFAPSGDYHVVVHNSVSCTTLLQAASNVTLTIPWNATSGPATSTFTYTRAVNNVAGEVTITDAGAITAGRYAWSLAILQIVYATPDAADCASSGVSGNSGPWTLVIA
jgi:hypothetical protein